MHVINDMYMYMYTYMYMYMYMYICYFLSTCFAAGVDCLRAIFVAFLSYT